MDGIHGQKNLIFKERLSYLARLLTFPPMVDQKIWGCYSNVAIVWLITTGVPRRALCESKIQIFKTANSNEILVILDNN